MNTETLKKSCMAFELPDGKIFLIHNDDIKKISEEIQLRFFTTDQRHVYMLQDTGLKRAMELYNIYKEQKGDMSKETKDDCLKTIIKFLSENDYELTTLDEKIKIHQAQKQAS